MNANYRADALDFAAHLLAERALEIGVRRALRQWYRERSGPGETNTLREKVEHARTR